MEMNLATDGQQAALSAANRTAFARTKCRQKTQPDHAVSAHGRWRGAWRASLVGLFTVGFFGSTSISNRPVSTGAIAVTDQALAGTWELMSVAGDSVGPNMPSTVLSQKVTFQNGSVSGVTRLRPGTEAATTAMPFPDASVTQIYTNPSSREVVVTWDGAYRLLPDGRIEVKMGARRFKIAARYNPINRALEMDSDAILTYRGGSCYHAVN